MASKLIGQKLKSEEPFSLGIRIKIGDPRNNFKSSNKMRYECTVDDHNKFYELHLLPEGANYLVDIKYGKIGTQGSFNKHRFTDEAGAKRFFQKKIDEKLKKGYRRVK